MCSYAGFWWHCVLCLQLFADTEFVNYMELLDKVIRMWVQTCVSLWHYTFLVWLNWSSVHNHACILSHVHTTRYTHTHARMHAHTCTHTHTHTHTYFNSHLHMIIIGIPCNTLCLYRTQHRSMHAQCFWVKKWVIILYPFLKISIAGLASIENKLSYHLSCTKNGIFSTPVLCQLQAFCFGNL